MTKNSNKLQKPAEVSKKKRELKLQNILNQMKPKMQKL